ncbi:MAG: flavodoxin domain-containing protein [Opitutales bacterium]
MELKVFYGTETGNCQSLAEKVAKKGEKNGVSVELIDLAGATPEKFGELDCPALVIISTWDDGAPPPKCVPFHEALMSSAVNLNHLRYTVLALGDEDYPAFCECGKQVDAKLADLGGTRIMDRADLGADFMVSYMGWSKAFWKTMAGVYGVTA